MGVYEADTIGGNLRRNINEGGVLNLGQGGNGSLIEYATLREYLPENVKNIILFFYENDTRNLSSEVNDPTIQKYLNDKNF